MAKDKQKSLTTAEENKFKAIQDILMGGEMRQIDGRFQQMQDRLEESHESLEKKLSQLQTDLNEKMGKQGDQLGSKLENLFAQLSEKLDRNHKFAKEEVARLDGEKSNRQELAKLFMMIGQALMREDDTE